ncbi:hypothetical protein [Providencia sp. PROV148]|uniref:hypothetical protein n=1 Tax=Providencia sp. PROV148 TaxID=2949858 RepID=UPI00234A0DC8|nr:hypothetical protein [Providencia sp. PROV148]
MSVTTIVAVWPNEDHGCIEELQNGFGSGPVIWNDMAIKYLGCDDFGYSRVIDSLWPLYKNKEIPYHQRAVLAMTYDNCYVKKEHYAEAAKCIRDYLVDFKPNEERVNHWPRIAEIFESNPDYPAIGFWLTSVCENPFSGDWNEETEEYDIYDWEKYWSVFDTMRAIESK